MVTNPHRLETSMPRSTSPKNKFVNNVQTTSPDFGKVEPNLNVSRPKPERTKSGTIGLINLQETKEFIQVWSPNPDRVEYVSEKLVEIGSEIKSYWNSSVNNIGNGSSSNESLI